MVRAIDVRLPDGRVIRAVDSGAPAPGAPAVVWHHGSPHTGELLAPLLTAARERGIRLVSYARPGYGGSTPNPGRDVASAAAEVDAIAEATGLGRFAVAGYSGGAPHALACAARLGERVTAAATLAGIAPYTGDDDWFAGMQAPGALRAAAESREARVRFAETDEFDPEQFVAADRAALEGEWSVLGRDAQRAEAVGPGGLVDDDVAFTRPWSVRLDEVRVPVLLVHGEPDRIVPRAHAVRMLAALPTARLWMRLDEGHVAVLNVLPDVFDWLVERSRSASGSRTPAGDGAR